MKALVTGVAGFIGSHLAEALLERDAHVLGIDSFTNYYARDLKQANLQALAADPRFELIESPLEAVDLRARLAETTHVFHLAAQAGVHRSWGRDFRVYTALNLDATQTLLEACATASIQRFVYASSSSVYGDHVALPMREDALPRPVSPYGVTKLAGEQLAMLYYHSYRVPTVALRYFTVYGPRQRPDMAFNRFLRAAMQEAPITVYGDGRQTRDFTFVGDAVAATIAAATAGVPGRVYNIGGGSRVAVNEALDLIAGCTGRVLDVRHETAQRGDMRDTYADTTLARRDLAFAPSVDLAAGLRAEYEWLARTAAFA